MLPIEASRGRGIFWGLFSRFIQNALPDTLNIVLAIQLKFAENVFVPSSPILVI